MPPINGGVQVIPGKWKSYHIENLVKNTHKPGQEIIFFDTETTGLKPEENSVIQLSAVKARVLEDHKLELGETLNEYFNPGYYVSEFITDLTGITNDFLQKQPSYKERHHAIKSFFGETPLVAAYNAPFDVRFMTKMYEDEGDTFTPSTIVDVCKIARQLVPLSDVGNHKLETITKHYGFDKDINFHDSMSDVKAMIRVYEQFVFEYETTQIRPEGLRVPFISNIWYWAGYNHLLTRIYVQTSDGKIYFGVRERIWESKEVDLSYIDMNKFIAECWRKCGATSEEEFIRYYREKAYKR